MRNISVSQVGSAGQLLGRLQLQPVQTVEVALDCVGDGVEQARGGSVARLLELAAEEGEGPRAVAEALLPGGGVEGQHAHAAALEAVHEGEHVPLPLLDVEADVLEAAEVEEGLQPQLPQQGVGHHRQEQGAAGGGHQLPQVVRAGVEAEVALDAVEVGHSRPSRPRARVLERGRLLGRGTADELEGEVAEQSLLLQLGDDGVGLWGERGGLGTVVGAHCPLPVGHFGEAGHQSPFPVGLQVDREAVLVELALKVAHCCLDDSSPGVEVVEVLLLGGVDVLAEGDDALLPVEDEAGLEGRVDLCARGLLLLGTALAEGLEHAPAEDLAGVDVGDAARLDLVVDLEHPAGSEGVAVDEVGELVEQAELVVDVHRVGQHSEPLLLLRLQAVLEGLTAGHRLQVPQHLRRPAVEGQSQAVAQLEVVLAGRGGHDVGELLPHHPSDPPEGVAAVVEVLAEGEVDGQAGAAAGSQQGDSPLETGPAGHLEQLAVVVEDVGGDLHRRDVDDVGLGWTVRGTGRLEDAAELAALQLQVVVGGELLPLRPAVRGDVDLVPDCARLLLPPETAPELGLAGLEPLQLAQLPLDYALLQPQVHQVAPELPLDLGCRPPLLHLPQEAPSLQPGSHPCLQPHSRPRLPGGAVEADARLGGVELADAFGVVEAGEHGVGLGLPALPDGLDELEDALGVGGEGGELVEAGELLHGAEEGADFGPALVVDPLELEELGGVVLALVVDEVYPDVVVLEGPLLLAPHQQLLLPLLPLYEPGQLHLAERAVDLGQFLLLLLAGQGRSRELALVRAGPGPLPVVVHQCPGALHRREGGGGVFLVGGGGLGREGHEGGGVEEGVEVGVDVGVEGEGDLLGGVEQRLHQLLAAAGGFELVKPVVQPVESLSAFDEGEGGSGFGVLLDHFRIESIEYSPTHPTGHMIYQMEHDEALNLDP